MIMNEKTAYSEIYAMRIRQLCKKRGISIKGTSKN